MIDAETVGLLVDRSVVALTLWAEARNQAVEVRIAVGSVMRNRLTNPGVYGATSATWKAVCLAPKQFSCWTANGGSNHAALMAKAEQILLNIEVEDAILDECFFLADGLMTGKLQDRSNGATFYLETRVLTRSPDALGVPGLKVCGTAGAFTFLKQ